MSTETDGNFVRVDWTTYRPLAPSVIPHVEHAADCPICARIHLTCEHTVANLFRENAKLKKKLRGRKK